MIPVTTISARRPLVIAFSTAIAAAAATAACGPDEPEFRGPIDADTYVAVMGELADLERFPLPGSDEATRSERADSARRAILERHGATAEQLLEFARAAGTRPDLMVELTARIVALSDSLAHRRTGAGGAADSAAARGPDLEPEPDRRPVAEAADSTPHGGLDRASLRERMRELREGRADAREPTP